LTVTRSTLSEASQARPAAAGPEQGVGPGYARIRDTVGVLEFSRGVLRLSGAEALDFLQGLVTNDLARLADGQGCPAAMLTPTGRIFAMVSVFRMTPADVLVLLQTPDAARVVEHLERYHFTEDVEISDLSGDTAWLSLQGPLAPTLAESMLGARSMPLPFGILTLDGPLPASAEESESEARSDAGSEAAQTDTASAQAAEDGAAKPEDLRIVWLDEVGVPAIHLLIERAAAAGLRRRLERKALELGGGLASIEDWNVCRVEAGVPWQGSELDETILPMEAGLDPLLSHEKGCYIGQEVVARATVQGKTNWSLWRVLVSSGGSVEPGAELRIAEKPRPVVRIRSVVSSPAFGRPLALAYVHRAAARPGPLILLGEQGQITAELDPSEK
jgi:folate-binding protein YgfZ